MFNKPMGCTPHGLDSVLIADHLNDALRRINVATSRVTTVIDVERPHHAASKNSTHLYVTCGAIELRVLLIMSECGTFTAQDIVAEFSETDVSYSMQISL